MTPFEATFVLKVILLSARSSFLKAHGWTFLLNNLNTQCWCTTIWSSALALFSAGKLKSAVIKEIFSSSLKWAFLWKGILISASMTVSTPRARMKGVSLVKTFWIVLWVKEHLTIHPPKLFFYPQAFFFCRIPLIILPIDSTWPLDWGWASEKNLLVAL